MIRFFFILLLFIFSCRQSPNEDSNQNFNLILLNKNRKLQITRDYQAIFRLNKSSYQIAKDRGYKEGMALCLINLASVNVGSDNYKSCFLLLKRAENLLADSNNKAVKALLYRRLASLNFILYFTDRARIYSEKSVYYAEQCNEDDKKKYFLDKVYITRGLIFADRKQNDSAITYYYKAKSVNSVAVNQAVILNYYRENRENSDSIQISINNILKMLQREKRDLPEHIPVYVGLGDYFTENGEYAKAENAYKNALNIINANKNMYRGTLPDIYSQLVQLYKITGNIKEEYNYLAKYNESRKWLDKKLEGTADLLINHYMTELKDTDEKNKKRNHLYIYLSSALIVLLFIYGLKKIQSLKSRKNAQDSEVEVLRAQIDNRKLNEIINLAKRNAPEFMKNFKDYYPNFIPGLLKINPNLENSELLFCAMLKLNFTSKEIAAYMFIQHDSVQKRKSRIRKRLNISSDANLYQFFEDL